jgi:NlpC/P60 family putative phage cell wall peptidase
MTIREQIVAEAREYIGTKFQHQARLKGVRVDCVGLIVGVAQTLKLSDADCGRYPRRPNGMLVPEITRAGYREIPTEDAVPGDLLVFWILPANKTPQHLGIKTDYGMIHTDARARRVVEVQVVGDWLERLCGAFVFPGVN